MLTNLLLIFTSLQIDHLGSYFVQGQYRNAKVDAQYIYFCTGRGFEIYDYGDATNPQLISSAATDGLATGIDVAGDYLYIADLYNGLCIFDLTDMANPTLMSHYSTGGSTEHVVVKDSIAYLADGENGLTILDVSDPTNPTYLGSWTQPDYYSVTVFIADTIAYLGNITNAPLKIINVANPTSPFLIANFPQGGLGGDIISAYVVDTLAFLSGTWTFPEGWYHFLIANVANPTNPVFISGLRFDGSTRKVIVQGDYAFANNQDDGIRIIDISDPEQPVEIICFDEAISYGYGPAVYDSIMIATESEEGFSIIDVAEPAQPVQLYHQPNFIWTSLAADDFRHYLYMTGVVRSHNETHTSLRFIDINNIMNPVMRSELNVLGCWYLSYGGPGIITDYPYVAFGTKRYPPGDDYLGVINISDIDYPELLRFETGTLAGPVALDSPYVYAGNYNKLVIGDVNSDVFWIDSVYTQTRCYGAVIYDSMAYAACLDNLAILNLNTGALLSTYYHYHYCAGWTGGIMLDYPYLFMSYDEFTLGHGFLIFDVSDPYAPSLLIDTLISEPTTPYSYVGAAEGSYLKDTLFFVCRGLSGFDIWNVSDPNLPINVCTQETPHSCDRVWVINDTILVMDATSIEVYSMTDIGVSEEYSSDLVGTTSFVDVFPNPFRNQTVIRYYLTQRTGNKEGNPAGAVLKIYNLSGRLVKLYVVTPNAPSSHRVDGSNSTIIWDGTDDRGHALAQGVYFITLETDDESFTKKTILLK